MKIFICSSKAFYDRIPPIQTKLEALGHEVELPNCFDDPSTEQRAKDAGEAEHAAFKKAMFERSAGIIEACDAILVLNFEKHGQANYIGGATFLEIYDAFKAGKPIYFYNPLPQGILHDELSSMVTAVIDGDLSKVS
ncbi:MAG TPA: hypothetical protein VFL81_02710 [Candidatus Saccharimonadales bacterium]|nr:hypothetical protein [Candidatus Saccharimonadales bacterium]